ncbi:MAG: transposase [Chloroflexi bacterium]|nr:transposase [Chloroflexota bacterium]
MSAVLEGYHRRSIRLPGYDYAQAGAYFLTIVAHDRECLFGEIVNGGMSPNSAGLAIESQWLNTPQLRPQAVLDEYVVMPNHFHAIVVIIGERRGVLQYAPTQYAPTFRSPSQTVGAIVRGFKSATTKRINVVRVAPGLPVWQRNYYEHIIRNEASLHHIRQYIANNPARWTFDPENPAAVGPEPEDAWLT